MALFLSYSAFNNTVNVIVLRAFCCNLVKLMNRSNKLDRLAMLLSGVCLLHCLLVPVALTLLPITTLSALVEDVLFHQLLLWVIVPTSSIALFIGCKKHRHGHIALTGVFGLLSLVMIGVFGHDLFSITGEKVATSAAGLVLAFSHYLNYQACQEITCTSVNCKKDHHH